MRRFTAALAELWGLFVEDGTFTIAILLCLGIAVFLLPRVLGTPWRGPALFVLLAAVLVENCYRTTRR